VDDILSRPSELKQQNVDLRHDSTIRAAQGSVRVKIGQTVEQIVQGLPSFLYHKGDCRSLFKPIDYVIFEGLTKKVKVDQIHFVDIKTGNAGLDDHEEQIERVINKKHVEFVRY
jgi:predicted Holliday junction resolvase-like endonuclease